MQFNNTKLVNSSNERSTTKTDNKSEIPASLLSLKTDQQISQKIDTKRWIESQTDCAE